MEFEYHKVIKSIFGNETNDFLYEDSENELKECAKKKEEILIGDKYIKSVEINFNNRLDQTIFTYKRYSENQMLELGVALKGEKCIYILYFPIIDFKWGNEMTKKSFYENIKKTFTIKKYEKFENGYFEKTLYKVVTRENKEILNEELKIAQNLEYALNEFNLNKGVKLNYLV